MDVAEWELVRRGVPPGRLLHRVAARFCSRDTLEHIVEPLLADMQQEWADAATPAARTRARVRGIAAFWHALLACSLWTASRAVRRAPAAITLPRAVGAWIIVRNVVILFFLHVVTENGRFTSVGALSALEKMPRFLLELLVGFVPVSIWFFVYSKLTGRSARIAVSLAVLAAGAFLGSFMPTAVLMGIKAADPSMTRRTS